MIEYLLDKFLSGNLLLSIRLNKMIPLMLPIPKIAIFIDLFLFTIEFEHFRINVDWTIFVVTEIIIVLEMVFVMFYLFVWYFLVIVFYFRLGFDFGDHVLLADVALLLGNDDGFCFWVGFLSQIWLWLRLGVGSRCRVIVADNRFFVPRRGYAVVFIAMGGFVVFDMFYRYFTFMFWIIIFVTNILLMVLPRLLFKQKIFKPIVIMLIMLIYITLPIIERIHTILTII